MSSTYFPNVIIWKVCVAGRLLQSILFVKQASKIGSHDSKSIILTIQQGALLSLNNVEDKEYEVLLEQDSCSTSIELSKMVYVDASTVGKLFKVLRTINMPLN